MQSNIQNPSPIQFAPFYLSVYEENNHISGINDSHITELLQEYYQKNGDINQVISDSKSKGEADNTEIVLEKYEKSHPAHGDKMFHNFLSKIQMNPGHVLR